jgi:hypothetical protein
MFLGRHQRLAVLLAVIGACFATPHQPARADSPHNGLVITFDLNKVTADPATGFASAPITQCNHGATTVSYFLVFNGNVLTERLPLTLSPGECEPADIGGPAGTGVTHWTLGGYDTTTGMVTGPTDHLFVFNK